LSDLYSKINSKNVDKATTSMQKLTNGVLKLIGAEKDAIA
jgi:hypothetical protein